MNIHADADTVHNFTDMRLWHETAFMTMDIDDDSIVTTNLTSFDSLPDGSDRSVWNAFSNQLMGEQHGCGYGVANVNDKMIFVTSILSSCPIRSRLNLTGSRETLKEDLGGANGAVFAEMRVDAPSDMDFTSAMAAAS
eukprot:CAMPEP_0206035562 /NCGR_PEP_ID=MMETSP1466-20131121/2168_1 /ASSEMBLY_ACC=CAM_ASM_001126 /TAXON_ID=44452 /ORGANISM="Pavlova gyrans, Strain CCMP608" /LENGTH=137 /DNA_ID=CAMNT_0053409949 /DNA_START=38 /DNA_END=451 /DNA_ORIENTATION=-